LNPSRARHIRDHTSRQLQIEKTLTVGGKSYTYLSLIAAEKNGLQGAFAITYSMKVLLETCCANEDGNSRCAPMTSGHRGFG